MYSSKGLFNNSYNFLNRKCVSFCPVNYFSDIKSNRCTKCHSKCNECQGPSEYNCTSCQEGLIKLDSNECVERCPIENGYFISI